MSKSEAHPNWAQAFYNWGTAMDYANRRARALGVRQKVYRQRRYSYLTPDWVVRSV